MPSALQPRLWLLPRLNTRKKQRHSTTIYSTTGASSGRKLAAARYPSMKKPTPMATSECTVRCSAARLASSNTSWLCATRSTAGTHQNTCLSNSASAPTRALIRQSNATPIPLPSMAMGKESTISKACRSTSTDGATRKAATRSRLPRKT